MRRPSVTLVIAVTALVVAAAGVARASIPAADGKIRGCYEADLAGSGGVLRNLYVVDERDACPPGTAELVWNQSGPPGAPGAQGPAGPAGTAEPPHGVFRTDVRFVQRDVEVLRGTGFKPPDASANVDCQQDETAIGGGASLQRLRLAPGAFALVASYPSKRQRAWTVEYEGSGAQGYPRGFAPILVIHAWAVCARTIVTAVPPMPPATGVKFGPRP